MEVVINGTVQTSRKSAKAVSRIARTPEGKRIAVRVIDADSPSFGEDFKSAFNANIRRVRRANKAVTTAA